MSNLAISSLPQVHARAHLIADRIDLKNFKITDSLATTPLTVTVGGSDGIAVLFRYGVVVLFGVSLGDEQRFLSSLAQLLHNAYGRPQLEEIAIQSGKTNVGVQGGAVWLDALTLEKAQVIADSLSKSLVLSMYEDKTASEFDSIIPLASELARTGKVSADAKTLLSKIGGMLLIEHRMVGRAEIGDKPETLWEHPELGGLYALLEDEYELHERQAALERKLQLISGTAQTLAEIAETKHVHRLEWYVIGLIALEIVIGLADLVHKYFF
ncbi:RMD1 family protein [Paraburkholderia caribensis]|uniref:RMD1 family protein n=1 Tax=Paraburkholderia caribensis TaxID=75105 RepID=UPI0015905ACB|nr:RMD1 family protein [Paraburkholderia caribensis]